MAVAPDRDRDLPSHPEIPRPLDIAANATQTLAGDDFAPMVADSGVGNVLAQSGCFDLTQSAPFYKLASGSPCIDRGVTSERVDTTVPVFDIDGVGHPRVLGAAADIGCSEKQ